jgi:predicted PurR-regulated permease PerM
MELNAANQIPAAEAPSLRQLLNVVLAAVIVCALYFGRDFLVPLTLAVLLAFVLTPLVQLLRRVRLPRVAAVVLAILLTVCMVAGAGAVIGSQVASLLQDLPKYQATITAKIGQIGGLTTGRFADLTGRLGLKAAEAGHQAAKAAGLTSKASVKTETGAAPVEIVQAPPTPLQMARQILTPVLRPMATAGLVFVVAIFILLQQSDLRDRLIRLIGSSDLYRTTTAMDDAAARLSRYFLSQLGVNTGFGAAVGAGLFFIGVPHAVLWGALSALLRFVPYVGALSSVGLAAGMAAAVDPGWTMVAWTVALVVIVEAVTGQVVEPFIYGHSTGLSPVSVVVAAVFWTWLWGPVGLILSTPLSLCLLVLGRHIPQLEFIEVLLGDRPPLTPVESFYQRILVGDADDILHQAELALKDGPLSSYYDQVAIRGLLLATSDARRRVLKRNQLPLVRGAVEALIADLSDHPDGESANGLVSPTEPEPVLNHVPQARAPRDITRSEAYVLCVCGPGMLDDLATAMLAQLLSRRGFRVRVAPNRDAARDTIGQLDTAGIDMICVLHLGVGGNPTRLHYLIGRLEQRARGAPIILAMPQADGTENFGADATRGEVRFRTLQEAVDACTAAVATSNSDKPAASKHRGRRAAAAVTAP